MRHRQLLTIYVKTIGSITIPNLIMFVKIRVRLIIKIFVLAGQKRVEPHIGNILLQPKPIEISQQTCSMLARSRQKQDLYTTMYTPYSQIRKWLDMKRSTRFSDFLRKNLHSESLNFKKISEHSSKCLEKSARKKMSITHDQCKKNDACNVAKCTQLP